MSPDAYVHPTALVEEAVTLGPGTTVWDNAHLRHGAVVGSDCIIGGKSYLANAVRIGDRCKINAMVYICSGVTMGDGVMVAAHSTFTNDFFPRACVNDLSDLRSSEVDGHTTFTTVQDGVTIGASATIGSDLVIGRFAMIGMGAVVTRSVAPYTLVLGNPARPVALVCRCGRPFASLRGGTPVDGRHECVRCSIAYDVEDGFVVRDPLDGLVPMPRPPAFPGVDDDTDPAELAG